MKYLLITALCLFPAFGQQPFDFSALNHLEPKAANRTNVTLDGQLLKLAVSFLNAVDDRDVNQIKALAGSLTGIYVRHLEFDKSDQYTDADLEPLRSTLRRAPWTRVVDVHERGGTSEIWIAQSAGGDKLAGVAIINAEPNELTVIYVSGLISPEDVAKLNGHFGIDVDALGNLSGAVRSRRRNK